MTYDDYQEGRDLLEQAEAVTDAIDRAESCAFNVLDNLQELNRIEREHALNLSACIQELIRAIDKARAELRSI